MASVHPFLITINFSILVYVGDEWGFQLASTLRSPKTFENSLTSSCQIHSWLRGVPSRLVHTGGDNQELK